MSSQLTNIRPNSEQHTKTSTAKRQLQHYNMISILQNETILAQLVLPPPSILQKLPRLRKLETRQDAIPLIRNAKQPIPQAQRNPRRPNLRHRLNLLRRNRRMVYPRHPRGLPRPSFHILLAERLNLERRTTTDSLPERDDFAQCEDVALDTAGYRPLALVFNCAGDDGCEILHCCERDLGVFRALGEDGPAVIQVDWKFHLVEVLGRRVWPGEVVGEESRVEEGVFEDFPLLI